MTLFEDIAIPISWPDQTARGDEAWMGFLKKIGLVKNLNFKVGHAAILLIERRTGAIRYYDFGRYIAPRGYGRARSALFDPRLEVKTQANWKENNLLNLKEILSELTSNEKATHGGGRLLCSIAEGINFKLATEYAERIVSKGPLLYGALANENNSCSRYVAQILTEGMDKQDSRIRSILYPECLKASPTSNVTNAARSGLIHIYTQNELSQKTMNRRQSLLFQIDLLKDNFYSARAAKLKDDSHPGLIGEPARHSTIPKKATWLGGIGEGVWMHLEQIDNLYLITRYHVSGEEDYKVVAYTEENFLYEAPYEFTFDIDYRKHVVNQSNQHITFHTSRETVHTLQTKII